MFIVFVKGFQGWTHEDLFKEFESLGGIVSAKVSLNKQHKSIGYGYVEFETMEYVAKAIKEKHGKPASKGGAILVVKPFEFFSKGNKKEKKFNNLYVKNFGTDLNDQQFTVIGFLYV